MYINDTVLNLVYSSTVEIKTQHDYVELKRLDLGDVWFVSGKIVAVDPDLIEENIPYSTVVPTGAYPISIFVAKDKDDDNRVALASIRIGKQKAVRWELAEFENGKTEDDYYLDIHGLGIDSGKVAVMDQRIADHILTQDIPLNAVLFDQMKETYVDTCSYAIGQVGSNSGPNEVVMFDIGWGDGCYPAFFGYDSNNNVCVFVIDSMILWDLEILSEKGSVANNFQPNNKL